MEDADFAEEEPEDEAYFRLGEQDEQFRDYASLALKEDHVNRFASCSCSPLTQQSMVSSGMQDELQALMPHSLWKDWLPRRATSCQRLSVEPMSSRCRSAAGLCGFARMAASS